LDQFLAISQNSLDFGGFLLLLLFSDRPFEYGLSNSTLLLGGEDRSDFSLLLGDKALTFFGEESLFDN
jgi:hypothetical protein